MVIKQFLMTYCYPHTSVLTRPSSEKLLEVDGQRALSETLDHLILSGMSPSSPFPQGICVEEDMERVEEPVGTDDSRETVSCRHRRTDGFINSETIAACMRLAQAQADEVPAPRKGSWAQAPSLLPPRSYHHLTPGSKGNLFFSSHVSLGIFTILP